MDKLKVPGYKLLLPQSWDKHGYARVAVYVKKSFDYVRVGELEDDHLQTIWIKGGFKGIIVICTGSILQTSVGQLMPRSRNST